MKPTPSEDLLFVGTHGYVAALNKFTGAEAWRTSLPKTGWSVVTLLHEDGVLFAGTGGQVFALNPATGEIAWNNTLPGLGSSHLCLATIRASPNAGAAPLPQIAQALEQSSSNQGAGGTS
jgi:outer membrane protein assembly factor BamB